MLHSNLLETYMPCARALLHMLCTYAQWSMQPLTFLSPSASHKRYSSRISPHSVTQGSVSLRFVAHFPSLKDLVHMPNLRHLYIRFISF